MRHLRQPRARRRLFNLTNGEFRPGRSTVSHVIDDLLTSVERTLLSARRLGGASSGVPTWPMLMAAWEKRPQTVTSATQTTSPTVTSARPPLRGGQSAVDEVTVRASAATFDELLSHPAVRVALEKGAVHPNRTQTDEDEKPPSDAAKAVAETADLFANDNCLQLEADSSELMETDDDYLQLEVDSGELTESDDGGDGPWTLAAIPYRGDARSRIRGTEWRNRHIRDTTTIMQKSSPEYVHHNRYR